MAALDYEFLEHTADLKIRAYGQDLPAVFSNSARAMMAYLFNLAEDQQATGEEEVSVAAADRSSLLVEWLSELLYLSVTKQRFYLRFQIQALVEQKITAVVGYVSAQAERDIKAVTYHDLQLVQKDGGWQAEIVYDI